MRYTTRAGGKIKFSHANKHTLPYSKHNYFLWLCFSLKFYKFFLFAFFQKRTVKNIIMQVIETDIIINSALLGAISGASDVNILNVSFNAPKEIRVNTSAVIFHPFM
jgi:hypothetical protein